ncbi:MAG: GNAT family N-acetyltransferase [Xanthobacteraceae bacterium]|nr:GNAT family N-acetyltransferase [Xanthobacteraceae bacterium]
MRDKIVVPGGALWLRPARPEDEDLRFDLFRQYRMEVLKLGRLSDAKIDELLTSQYESRMRSFRERFPRANWSVVEFEEMPIGELVVDDSPDGLCVVDVALRPDCQRRGFGSALIRALTATAGGRGVRAMVLMTNAASLGMFRRLGFVDSGHDSAHIELRWPPLREIKGGG